MTYPKPYTIIYNIGATLNITLPIGSAVLRRALLNIEEALQPAEDLMIVSVSEFGGTASLVIE